MYRYDQAMVSWCHHYTFTISDSLEFEFQVAEKVKEINPESTECPEEYVSQ